MKFKVTKHFGMFQFWHIDCQEGSHESPMYKPRRLDDLKEEIHCPACGEKGVVNTTDLTKGWGESINRIRSGGGV